MLFTRKRHIGQFDDLLINKLLIKRSNKYGGGWYGGG